MAAISFRGSPPAAPTRRPGDIANSPVGGCAPGGPRSNPDARSDARDLRTCSASATPSRASPRPSVPFEARRSWVSWRVSSRRPATTNRRWARGRESVARRWRVGARRRREPPRTEAISSWTPSRASRLFLRPSSGFSPRREWRSRSIASRREASAAGLPRRARRRLSELSHPLRPPPAAATVARRIHSRSARRRAASSCRACMRSRNACPRSSRRRRLSSASRDDRDSPRGRRAGRIPASLNDAAR